MNKNRILARLDAYEKLIRLDRPIGILLLLWPTLWALWLASRGVPHAILFVGFIMGTILMRSAGCALNDFADRKFDAHVQRTRHRPLAAESIQPWEALAVAAVCALLAFAIVLNFNRLTVELSFAALAVAVVYPFLKRFFWMPQAWLGVAFGFGIPLAYAAQRASVPPVAWALVAANVFWTIAYDTEYAMVDRDDDRKLGLRTSAIFFGRHDVAAVMAFYALFIAAMAAIGAWQHYGAFYYGGLAVAAALCLVHYRWIRGRTREGAFRAFLGNNWVGAAIFLGIFLDYKPWLLLKRWLP